MMPTVVSVEQTGPYRLRLQFDNGAEGELDIKAYLPFEGVFEPLKDPSYFAQVRVDAAAGAIVWPNGADLDPWVLHSRVTGIPIPDTDVDAGADTDQAFSPAQRLSWQRLEPGEISRFLGIVVDMACKEDAPPHFHARYETTSAVIELPSLRLLRGDLFPRALGFVREWASMHRDELMQDWELARTGQALKPIAPLE